jgi:hypothetical protein
MTTDIVVEEVANVVLCSRVIPLLTIVANQINNFPWNGRQPLSFGWSRYSPARLFAREAVDSLDCYCCCYGMVWSVKYGFDVVRRCLRFVPFYS